MRVFDEHKDYAVDEVNHPERVLQRGLVTLGHMRALGVVAVVVMIGVTIASDAGTAGFVALAVALGYAALTAREFFVGEWLSPKMVLYALTHAVTMPLAVWWVATMIAQESIWGSSSVLVFGLLAFLLSMTGETARKINAPEDERESEPTYSSHLGVATVARVVSGLALDIVIVTALLLAVMAGGWTTSVIVASLFVAALGLGTVMTAMSYSSEPTAKNAARIPDVAGLLGAAAVVAVFVVEVLL